MNKVIYIVIAVAVLVGGFFILNSYIYNQKQAVNTPAPVIPAEEGVVSLSGVVSEVDLEQMMVDGPARITFSAANGTAHVIAVPSFGRNMCNAKADIADVGTIKVGDSVEVRGEIGEEGVIIPCMGDTHYLRVSAQ